MPRVRASRTFMPSGSRPSPLECLESPKIPQSVRAIAILALNGSWEAHGRLIRALDKRNPLACEYDMEFIPMLCFYLDRELLADDPPRDSPAFLAACSSFQVLTQIAMRCERCDPPDEAQIETFLARLLPYWPDVWAWIAYFERDNPYLDLDSASLVQGIDGAGHDLLTIFLGALIFTRNPDINGFLRGGDALKLLIRIWVAEAGVPNVRQTRASSNLREMLPDDPKKMDPIWFEGMREAVGGDLRKLASLTLRRIDVFLRNGASPTSHDFVADMYIVTWLCTDRAFSAAFIEEGIVATVVRVLSYTVKFDYQGLPPSDPNRAPTFMALPCLNYIRSTFFAPTDLTTLHQLLNAGLILTLLCCSTSLRCSAEPYSYRDAVESLCAGLLTELLPPYFVFRSIVRAAVASMPKAKDFAYADGQLENASPELQRLWTEFFQLVDERLVIKVFADKDCEFQTCGNEKCRRRDKVESFKKCSVCGEHYCSRECQRADWKQDHRRECQEAIDAIARSRSDGYVYEPHKQRTFFRNLIASDFRKNPTRVSWSTRMVTVFDYASGKAAPDIAIWPIHNYDFALGDYDVEADWLRVFHHNFMVLSRTEPRLIPVYARVRSGGAYRTISVTLLGPEDKRTRQGKKIRRL